MRLKLCQKLKNNKRRPKSTGFYKKKRVLTLWDEVQKSIKALFQSVKYLEQNKPVPVTHLTVDR